MVSKKLLMYSFTTALSIGTLSTIPSISAIDYNKQEEQKNKTQYYYSSDYSYNHLLNMKDETLQSFNKVIFSNGKYQEIESNIRNDLPNLKDFKIDIVKDATFVKKVNDVNVFSAMFQFVPNENSTWLDKTKQEKNILINFTNIKTPLKSTNEKLASVGINPTFNKMVELDLLNRAYLNKYILINQKSVFDYKNFTNSSLFKNVKLVPNLESLKVVDNKGSIELKVTPITKTFWDNGTNKEKNINLSFQLKYTNKNIAIAPYKDKSNIEIILPYLNTQTLKDYFNNTKNVTKLVDSLLSNGNYRNVDIESISKVYKDKSSYYLQVVAAAKNNLKINLKNQKQNIDILLSNIANQKWSNDAKFENHFTVQTWWNKELNVMKDLKSQIFAKENFNLFKDKFEKQYPNLKIYSFDYSTAYVGKFIFSWDPSYKAYVDVEIVPKFKHLWHDKTYSKKKSRLFIEGWYID